MSLVKNSILAASTVLTLQISTLPARADGGNLLGGVVVGAILYCGISGRCTGKQRGGQAGDQVALDREQKMMVQEGLAYSGYYDGAIDGAIGPGSRNAIAAYQESVDAPKTGYLTAEQTTDLMRLSTHYRAVPDNDDRLFALEFTDDLETDQVRLLQAELNAQGYDSGTPDGKVGRNTRTAIAAFKDDNGFDGPPVATHLLLARVTNTDMSVMPNVSAMNAGEFGMIGKYETIETSELSCEGTPIVITPTRMEMYESVCTFPTPLDGTETHISANMVCNSEGEVFASLRELSLNGSDLEVLYEGEYSFTYRRCDAPTEAAARVDNGINFHAPTRAEESLIQTTKIAQAIDICQGDSEGSSRPLPISQCVQVADLDMSSEDQLMLVQFINPSFCGSAGCQTYVMQIDGETAGIIADTYAHSTALVDVSGRNGLSLDNRTYLFDGEELVETRTVASN